MEALKTSVVCSHAVRTGMEVDGTFQEYMVSGCFVEAGVADSHVTNHVPSSIKVAWAEHLVPLPAELSDEDAVPILCAGLTVYKGLKISNTKVGDWVVIPGAGGGLGHLGTFRVSCLIFSEHA